MSLFAWIKKAFTKKPERIVGKKYYAADWKNEEWTQILEDAIDVLGQNLLNMDLGIEGNKRQFWIMLFSSLARFESGHNPKATYTEKFADIKGNRVVSRGLFQLSIESANQKRYGCNLKSAEELHDPGTNIRCAVRIADYLVKTDGRIYGREPRYLGMSRYWSPFRDDIKTKKIMDQARAAAKA